MSEQQHLPAGAAPGPGGAVPGAGLREPGSLPYPDLPAGTDTIPQIKHIVVLVMENHSYDNHLGMLRRAGADGFTLGPDGRPAAVNPYPDGRLQHAFRMPDTCQVLFKPTQTWPNAHAQIDGGKMDGFVRSGSGPVSMGYWDHTQLPFYYSLASVFPLADRYFCSVPGPTYPNRRFLIAATSMGMTGDSIPSLTAHPANGTIFDKLHEAGVTWKDYYSRWSLVPTLALFPELLVRYHGNVTDTDGFFADAAAGTLPQFSLVEPNYLLKSEETPQNIAWGEQFAAKVIDAVMAGPGWEHTLLLWLFDEHGGYYDHVPPPRAIAPDDVPPHVDDNGPVFEGFGRYGVRVPCVAVSPWARPDYVSHQVFDHASICALAEAKWNLPAMTRRDANANNMLDMVDLTGAPAFATPPALAQPLAGTDPEVLLRILDPGTIPPPGTVSPALPAAPH
ncbi:MAG: alkaline phosphatase family protein [Streptosporangiaceae bacterium]